MNKNILFVCRYNRFRSKIAENYFNKINKNAKFRAKSAGIIKGSDIDSSQKKIAKSLGIDISGFPNGLSTKLLRWQDIIVIVADDVPKEIFKDNPKYGKELVIWKIPDAKTNDDVETKLIIKSIKSRVDKLISELN